MLCLLVGLTVHIDLQNIDRVNIFSLANQAESPATSYNLNHHIAELPVLAPQYVAQPIELLLPLISLSNKITLDASQSKPKNFTNFFYFMGERDF